MMQIEFKFHPGQTAIVLTGAFNNKAVRVIECQYRNGKSYLCEVIGEGVTTVFDEDQLVRKDFCDTTPAPTHFDEEQLSVVEVVAVAPETTPMTTAEFHAGLAATAALTMVNDGGPDMVDDGGPDTELDDEDELDPEDDPDAEDAALEGES